MNKPQRNYKLQPNSWSCGPSALHNALLSIGERHSIKKLCKLSGTTKTQCPDTKGLCKAAKALGFVLGVHQNHTHLYTKEQISWYLRRRTPILVCVDRDKEGLYAHWIAVVKTTSRHVWVADSSRPPPVLMRMTWRSFLARAAAVHGPKDIQYDLYPLRRAK